MFESLIEKYLLKNNHMLKLQHIPDKTEAEKQEALLANKI